MATPVQSVGDEAGKLDLFILRGDFEGPRVFIWEEPLGTPVDLTGYTVRMTGRYKTWTGPIAFHLILGNGLTLDGPAGRVDYTLVNATTVNLKPIANPNDLSFSGYWQITYTDPAGAPRTLLRGQFTVLPYVPPEA